MSHYRLKAPISAALDNSGGLKLSKRIPAGAVLYDSPKHSTTLIGKIGVSWEGRHYSVSLQDMLKNAEFVQSA